MENKYSPMDISTCLADPQILLSEALANRNIQNFRAALEAGAQPLAIDDGHNSVFEEALKTSGCVEFVKECLKTGCSPNHVNRHYKKAVINYATDSRDPHIIGAVLSHKGVNVNFKFSELTPLNSLAKALHQENIDDVFKCMQILLEYGASPNIPDQREMTPLHYVVQNKKIDDLKKRQIVQQFISRPEIDIDTYRLGELRGIMEERYPDMKLPIKQENHRITYHTLLTHIRNADMDKFHKQFTSMLRITTDEENLLLLNESIVRGAHLSFDLLMESSVSYNNTLSDNNTPLEIAYIYGNWYALEKLLQQADIKIQPNYYPLITIVRKLNESSSLIFCDYWKCFEVLLNTNKIDINQMDRSRSTALHYAVKYRNNKAIKKLLQKGADISIRNIFNELPIDDMHPEVLGDHFDSCVSSNGFKPGDEKYEIVINFRNFRPENKPNQSFKENMGPIAFMAKSKDFRPLLQHPVVTSILYLKWHKLSFIFYLNFMLYLFYAVSVIAHVVLKFRLSEYKLALEITEKMSWLGICYLTVRESIQLIVCPKRYFSSFTNFAEVILIMLSITTCSSFHFADAFQLQIAVCTMLLAALELCLLVGSLPVSSISTHMLMLEAVCKSFLKSFLFYSIFVITFALCFYVMNEETTISDEKAFSNFATPMVALSKTIVMLTGEFDASDLKLEPFNIFIFLIFVFFMTIVLLNLLNGLAISDTQAIRDQAELNFIICRTNLLARYEQTLIERSRQTKSLFKHQPFRFLYHCYVYLFPDYTRGSQISILPNDNNKIVMPKMKYEQSIETLEATESKSHVIVPLTTEHKEFKRKKLVPCCFAFIVGKFSKIDYRTVQLAMAILERKSETNTQNRLTSIEQKLEEILKRMKDQKSRNNSVVASCNTQSCQ